MKNKKSKSNRKKGTTTPQRKQESVSAHTNDSSKIENNSISKEENTVQHGFIFGKKNYKFMFIGLAVIAFGFILMAGGGSDDPNVFNEAIFSTRRIHIAPMVIVIGFIIEVYAILLNPNSDS